MFDHIEESDTNNDPPKPPAEKPIEKPAEKPKMEKEKPSECSWPACYVLVTMPVWPQEN